MRNSRAQRTKKILIGENSGCTGWLTFNVQGVFALLIDDVAWANGVDGTHIHGKNAVFALITVVENRRSLRWPASKRRAERSTTKLEIAKTYLSDTFFRRNARIRLAI